MEDPIVPVAEEKRGFSLNVGRLSIMNLITFGLQMLAAALCLVFAIMNYLFYKADELHLHQFFGENVPQGAFASPQDGFLTFCIVFAVLGIISLVMLFCLFATRGQGKKKYYICNLIILAISCICGIYYLFEFHLVPAELGSGWAIIMELAEALNINLSSGVKYPWPEEFIAIFSGLSIVFMCRKKARRYMIQGDDA